MWLNPVAPPNFSKSSSTINAMKQQPLEFLQHKVCISTSEVLSQVHDTSSHPQKGKDEEIVVTLFKY